MCFFQIVAKRADWLTLLLLPSGFFRVLLESLFLRVVSLFNWKDSSRTNYWNKSSTITYAVKWVSASCKCFQYHRNEFCVLRRQTYFPRCTHEIHESLQIPGGSHHQPEVQVRTARPGCVSVSRCFLSRYVFSNIYPLFSVRVWDIRISLVQILPAPRFHSLLTSRRERSSCEEPLKGCCALSYIWVEPWPLGLGSHAWHPSCKL